jgi:hypothetical protein
MSIRNILDFDLDKPEWVKLRSNTHNVDSHYIFQHRDGELPDGQINPESGTVYSKDDTHLYYKPHNGVEQRLNQGNPANGGIFLARDSSVYPFQSRTGPQADNGLAFNANLQQYETTETGLSDVGIIVGSEELNRLGQFVAIKHQNDNQEPVYVCVRTRGTLATQEGILQDDKIGGFYGVGRTDAGTFEVGGIMQYEAENDFTGTNASARWVLRLTEANEVTTSEAFIINSDAVMDIRETVAPASGKSGFGRIYVKSSDGLPYFKDNAGVEYPLIGGGAGSNIYDNDGTLAGNRTVDQDSNDLIFTNGTLTADALNISNLPPTDNTEDAVLVRDSVSGNIEIRSASTINPNTDTNIFNSDGALTGVRTVNQATNNLNFTNGQTSVSQLNISALPPTDNTEDAVLVRDAISGNIEIRSAATIGGGGSQDLQQTYDNSADGNIDLSWETPGTFQITDPDDTNNILFKVTDSTGIREYLNVRAGQFSAATNIGFVGVSNGAVVGNNSSLTNCSDSYIYGKDSLLTTASDTCVVGNNNQIQQTAGNSTNLFVGGNRNTINETSLIAPYNSAIIGFDNTGDDCDNNVIIGQGNTSNAPNNVLIGRNINTSVDTIATSINFNANDVACSPKVNESVNFFHVRNGFGIFDRTDNRDFNTTDGNVAWYTQSNFITDIQTGITVQIDTLPFRSANTNNTFLLVSDNIIIRDDQNDTDAEHVRSEGIVTWRSDTTTLAVISTVNTVVRAGSYLENPIYFISGNTIQMRFPANTIPSGITYRVNTATKLIVCNSPQV